MIMMIEDPKMDMQQDMAIETGRTLKEMVDDLKDGELLSVPLEGVVITNGQKTE